MSDKKMSLGEIVQALKEFGAEADIAFADLKKTAKFNTFFGTFHPHAEPNMAIKRRQNTLRKLSREELLELCRAADAMRTEIRAVLSEPTTFTEENDG